MKYIKLLAGITLVIVSAFNTSCVFAMTSDIKVLLVTGRANKYHNWQASSSAILSHLNSAGIFKTEKIETSKGGESLKDFAPKWTDFDVVVLDYEGDEWPSSTKEAFVDYIKNGGGLVSIHATNNSFPSWPEFNEMLGLGGWGGASLHSPPLNAGKNRNEKWGPRVYYYKGQLNIKNTAGGAFHPPKQTFIATTRNFEHPITRDLPENWLVSADEIYSGLRGPAKNLEVLATGFADPDKGKPSPYHEPILMTIKYGEGRVFHSTLGHVGKNDNEHAPSLQNVAFITTLLRGTEWAASGKVTQSIPSDFPTVYKPSVRTKKQQ